MSQVDRVQDYMKTHGSITQAEAIEALGCYRLGARIADLKSRGVAVDRMMEEGQNRFGERTRYARYFLGKRSEANG